MSEGRTLMKEEKKNDRKPKTNVCLSICVSRRYENRSNMQYIEKEYTYVSDQAG